MVPAVFVLAEHIDQHSFNDRYIHANASGNPLCVGRDLALDVVVHIQQAAVSQVLVVGQMGGSGPVVTNVVLVVVHIYLTFSVVVTKRSSGRTVTNRLFGSYPSRASTGYTIKLSV